MMALLMGLKTIAPDSLLSLVNARQVAVIDVNSPQRFQAGHVPSAINLDPHNYVSADLPQDQESALVFYCSNPMCRKAPQAARRAKAMGYRNVSVMAAGISGWESAGLPVQNTSERAMPGQ